MTKTLLLGKHHATQQCVIVIASDPTSVGDGMISYQIEIINIVVILIILTDIVIDKHAIF